MTNFLSSFKLWQKIVLILSAFLLPIGVLAYTAFGLFAEHLQLASLERASIVLQHPLAELVRQVGDHHLITQQAFGGDESVKGRLSADEALVEKAFESFEQALRQAPPELSFAAQSGEANAVQPDQARKAWETLQGNWQKIGVVASEHAHEKLIIIFRELMAKIVNTSLAIDPDLDSYYLVDVAFSSAPALTDHLNQLNEHGPRYLREPTPANLFDLARKMALLQEEYLPRLEHAVTTALREDANFHGISPSLQRELPSRLATLKSTSTRARRLAAALRYWGARAQCTMLQSGPSRDGSHRASAQDHAGPSDRQRRPCHLLQHPPAA